MENKTQSLNDIYLRMNELIKPIDQQIMMCDNREDLLMMASIMMTTAMRIYDIQIGTENRKKILLDFVV
jgi:hypothetical protein